MNILDILISYREYAAQEYAAGREPMLYSDWKTAYAIAVSPENEPEPAVA